MSEKNKKIYVYDDDKHLIEGTIDDFIEVDKNHGGDGTGYEERECGLFYFGKYIAGEKK